MNAIFSVDDNWAIGNNGDLLFSFEEDMKHFREKTMGKTVVMGYNTLLSLPGQRPLRDRTNIILSKRKGLEIEGAIVCRNLKALGQVLKDIPSDEIFVIGGAQIFEYLLPYCGRAYVTRWGNVAKQADCHVMNLHKEPTWQVVEQSRVMKEGAEAFMFLTYVNMAMQPFNP